MKYLVLVFVIVLAGANLSCSSSKTVARATMSDSDGGRKSEEGTPGMSFKDAIKVGSINEEYAWIRKTYPGSRVTSQALVEKDKVHYDVLNFSMPDGKAKSAYFDISSFYGKF